MSSRSDPEIHCEKQSFGEGMVRLVEETCDQNAK